MSAAAEPQIPLGELTALPQTLSRPILLIDGNAILPPLSECPFLACSVCGVFYVLF